MFQSSTCSTNPPRKTLKRHGKGFERTPRSGTRKSGRSSSVDRTPMARASFPPFLSEVTLPSIHGSASAVSSVNCTASLSAGPPAHDARHGLIGRRYGNVSSKSTPGFDAWTMGVGVDLFADDPGASKAIYEMRFVKSGAGYALFGQFFIGVRLRLRNSAAARRSYEVGKLWIAFDCSREEQLQQLRVWWSR